MKIEIPFEETVYPVVDFGDKMTGRENIVWTYDKLFRKGQLLLIAGGDGSGKTTSALYFMKSILSQEPIFGVTSHNNDFKTAFYVNYDVLDASLMKTMSMHYLCKGMYTHPDEFDPPKLDTPEGKKWFKYLVSKYDIVVIDTLSNSHSGDENSERDMKEILRFLKQQAGTDKLIIVLHHTTKASGDVRGSGAIKANVDTVIKSIEDRRKGIFRMWYLKNRGADKKMVFQYTISLRDKGTWVEPLVSITKEELKKEKEQVLSKNILSGVENGYDTIDKLSTYLKNSDNTLRPIIKKLLQDGVLVRDSGKSTAPLRIK